MGDSYQGEVICPADCGRCLTVRSVVICHPHSISIAGESEHQMAGMAQRVMRPALEKREVKYIVRAPDANNRGRWNTVGVAFERKNGADGLTIKLNTLPVGNWDGSLILLPPLLPEEDAANDD